MNDDVITDLKQFITATISQQATQLDQKIDALGSKLSAQINDLQEAVSEALDTSNDAVNEQLQDHERRLGLLEAKAA